MRKMKMMNYNLLKQNIQVLQDYAQIPGIFSRPITAAQVLNIRNRMSPVDTYTENYPVHVNRYMSANEALIFPDQNGQAWLNPIALGQMIAILDLIISEEYEPGCWQCIHPLIKKASRELFLHEHYANAAEDAFIEINDRAKSIYKNMKPDEPESDGCDLMNKLFNLKNPLIALDNLNTEMGKNIQQGFHFMFSGSVSAFRNPKAHSNYVVIDAREAMRRMMFASALMYKLDEIDNYSKTSND